MNINGIVRSGRILVVAALAIGSACSGSQVPAANTGGQQAAKAPGSAQLGERPFGFPLANRPVPRPKPSHRRSWMSPAAKKSALLYVSDADNAVVDVYSYKTPNKKGLLGQLTGFNVPVGECSDRLGNVYVTDYGAQDVVEYAHGGTKPIRTLNATGYDFGCSVDRKSGNLAVSALANANPSTQCGGVWVFLNASGTPTFYEDPNVCYYGSPGYDNRSNLFVEVQVSGSKAIYGLDELANGGSGLAELALSGFSITQGSSVMWDGKYVGVGDQDYQGSQTTAIYRVTVSNGTATLVSTVELTDTCDGSTNYDDTVQPSIDGTKVLGANLYCNYRFGYWAYPNGGNPKKIIDSTIAPEAAYGEAVSRAL